MAISKVKNTENVSSEYIQLKNNSSVAHSNTNAVSWAAILAGATAAAALSLILLILGAGLGLSSISPWVNKGVSASTFGVSTIIWLAVTQILAAGMGGYLAGRLRVKWADVDADEVYFRDTAHGFLAWGVATLATAALLTSVIGAVVSGGVQATASLAGGAANAAIAGGVVAADKATPDSGNEAGAMDYLMDTLFRKSSQDASATLTERRLTTTSNAQTTLPTAEVTRIFINANRTESLPPADLTYIGEIVSRHAGVTQEEAEQRVNDVYANIQTQKQKVEIAAKEAADKARKVSIYTTLWLFVSLLMGAFSASLAATWGGRSRDA